METDRLLAPSNEVQKSVESLWQMVRRAGDIMAAKQQHDADMQTRISLLESELEAKADLIATQNTTLESWKEEIATIDELRASMKGLYEKVNDLQATVQDRDLRIERLLAEAQIQSQNTVELEQLQQRLRSAESDVLAWQTRAENMEQSLQERGMQVAEAENQVRIQRAELQALRAEHELRQSTAHKEIQELLVATTELRRQIAQAESQQQISSDEIARLERNAEDLRTKLQRQDDATTEYKAQLMEMTARMYEREKQAVLAEEKLHILEQAEQNQQELSAADSLLRSEIEQYKVRVSQFEQELEALRVEVQTVTNQRDELSRAAEETSTDSPLSQLANSIRQTADYLSQGDSDANDSALRIGAQRQSIHGIVEKLRSAVRLLEGAVVS